MTSLRNATIFCGVRPAMIHRPYSSLEVLLSKYCQCCAKSSSHTRPLGSEVEMNRGEKTEDREEKCGERQKGFLLLRENLFRDQGLLHFLYRSRSMNSPVTTSTTGSSTCCSTDNNTLSSISPTMMRGNARGAIRKSTNSHKSPCLSRCIGGSSSHK